MAGIGEASAILAVAQIGISLSNTLIAYVGEVHDAPFRIQRIGNEVLTTSERLKDIGELVEKNEQTRIFSDEGVQSAVRCSDECHKILNELRSVLGKSGWHQLGKRDDKVEIDTSLFSTLRWPFVKIKLEVPRAELERIKVDLMLLFSSAMALGASSAVEKAKFRQDIPGLNRTRDWAARMAEQAKKRALDRERDPRGRKRTEDEDWIEGDPEILQEFVDYQERRIREEEDKRTAELAARVAAENEEKRKQAEAERRALEKEILERHEKEQAEKYARNIKMKESLRDELERAGLTLTPEQIDTIVESSSLSYVPAKDHQYSPPAVLRMSSSRDASNESVSTRSRSRKAERSSMNKIEKWRLKLPWHGRKAARHGSSSVASHDHSASEKGNNGPVNTTLRNWSFQVETWLIDVFSNERIMLWPSDEWQDAKLNKILKKGGDVWHQFARLKPLWRRAVLQFLEFKKQEENSDWSLLSVELPQRSSHTRIFGHRRDDQLIQLILFSRSDTSPPPSNGSVRRGNASETRSQVRYTVGTRNSNDIKEEIRQLEAERDALKLEKSHSEAGRREDMVRPQERVEVIESRRGVNPYNQPVEVIETKRNDDVTSREYMYAGNRNKELPHSLERVDLDRTEHERSRPHGESYRDTREEIIVREVPRSREGLREDEAIGIQRTSTIPERRPVYDEQYIDIRRKSPSPERRPVYEEDIDIRRKSKSPQRRTYSEAEFFPLRDSFDLVQRQDPSSPQNQQLVINRSEEADARATRRADRRSRREMWMASSESSRERSKSVVRQSKRPGRYYNFERPARRSTIENTGERSTYRDRALVRRSPSPYRHKDQPLALVRRQAGSRRVDDYMQDHVLDTSIRIRGDDHPGSPIDRHSRQKRSTAPFRTRQNTFRERGRMPMNRRLRWRKEEDSEYEDERAQAGYVEMKKSGPKPEPTDEELIERTLLKFTSDEARRKSTILPTDLAPMASPAASTRTKRRAAGPPEAAVLSSIRPNDEQYGPQNYHISTTFTAPPHWDEQGFVYSFPEEGSRKSSIEKVSFHQKPNAHGSYAGATSEEPTITADEDKSSGPLRSNLPQLQDRVNEDSRSGRIVPDRSQHTGHEASPVEKGGTTSPKRTLSMTKDGVVSDQEIASYMRRLKALESASEASAKRREAERLLREAEELSRLDGVSDVEDGSRQSIERITPKSRAATVEDFTPEMENHNKNDEQDTKE